MTDEFRIKRDHKLGCLFRQWAWGTEFPHYDFNYALTDAGARRPARRAARRNKLIALIEFEFISFIPSEGLIHV